MSLYEILFGVPLVAGVLLVLGLALGVADLGGELDMDIDDGVEGDADGLLVALGVGRVPLSVLLLLLLLSFGGIGFVIYPLLALAVGAGLALVAAWLLAGLGSLLVTRLLG